MGATRSVGGVVLAVSLTVGTASPVVATSTWSDNGYQWNVHNPPFTVSVTDHTSASWAGRVQRAAADWSLSSTVDVKVGKSGKVDIYDGDYGPTYCGWAVFYFHGGSVAKVLIYLNDTCLSDPSNEFRQTVLCQEMGHALGLGDHRTDVPATPSCMAPQNYGPSPNQDDFDQLAAVYP
jgi:hypothetical protein